MNGLCRELMSELLAAGAATAKDYEPGENERNAGNHGKKIVTLFGELPPIKRTYYWNEDTHKGHYPFDDKLGLIGRYTPAAANEMSRFAVKHSYKDAAEDFSRCHAFKVSADTIREVVGMRYTESSAFVKGNGDGHRDSFTVIGQRFKQSGMIWSLKGAKALLPLRTLYKSNRLEEFFSYPIKNLKQVDCVA